jgi:hypothetical protein
MIIVQRGVAKKGETQTPVEKRFTIARPLLFDTAREFTEVYRLWTVFLNSERERPLWTGKTLSAIGQYFGSGQFHHEVNLLLPEVVEQREKTKSSVGSHALRACYAAFIILNLKNHQYYDNKTSYNDLYLLQKILGHNNHKTTYLYQYINAVNYLPTDGVFDRDLPQEQLTHLQTELEITNDKIQQTVDSIDEKIESAVKAALSEVKVCTKRKAESDDLEPSLKKKKQKRKFTEDERAQRLASAIEILKKQNLPPTQRNVRKIGGLTNAEFSGNHKSGFWNSVFRDGKWI